MRLTLLVGCFLLSCSDGTVGPVVKLPNEQCGQPCSPGNAPALYSRGECRLGTWHCAEDGGDDWWCADYVGPTTEVCDGLDNDCNGEVDNGVARCKPQAEVCNGQDDDLDGAVDEEYVGHYCYDGPQNTLGHGACHPGFTKCMGGVEVCAGEQLPRSETCDGQDNDCDDQVDEGLFTTAVDFVLVFDNSGSMTDKAANLKVAIRDWVNKYPTNTDRRYAVVTAPDNDYSRYDAYPQLFAQFGSMSDFILAVDQQTGQMGAGIEATIDALAGIVDPANPFGLAWRPNARCLVVAFSDEEPQSYKTSNTLSTLAVQLAASRCKVYAFVLDGKFDWDYLTAAGHGRTFPITEPIYAIDGHLDDIISAGSCN